MAEQQALAYVNWGRWVVECPYGCGNALTLPPGEPTYFCKDTSGLGGCHRSAAIVWPVNADQIWSELLARPAAKNRNWFPQGHPTAVQGGMPHGQTIADLHAETDKYAVDQVAPPNPSKRRDLDRLLASFGYQVAPDGESLRRL